VAEGESDDVGGDFGAGSDGFVDPAGDGPRVPAPAHDVVAAAEQGDEVGLEFRRGRDLLGDDLVEPPSPDGDVGVAEARLALCEAAGDEVGPAAVGALVRVRVVEAFGAAVAEDDETVVAHPDLRNPWFTL